MRSGSEIELRMVTGHIAIEAAPLAVRLERRGGLVVAVPAKGAKPLKTADVETATDSVRSGRGAAGRASR